MTLKFISKCRCFGIMHTWNVLRNKCTNEKKKLLVNINCISDKCFCMCITYTRLDTLLLRLLSYYSGKKPQGKPILLMISAQCRGMIKPHLHCGNTSVAKKHLNWDTCTHMMKRASWKVTWVISFCSYGFPQGISLISLSISGWLIYSVAFMMLDS